MIASDARRKAAMIPTADSACSATWRYRLSKNPPCSPTPVFSRNELGTHQPPLRTQIAPNAAMARSGGIRIAGINDQRR
jgi:hypothetical protein